MPRQLVKALSLAFVMVLSIGCTVTEMEVSKTIGSSSASKVSASSHDNKRNKQKEASDTYVQLGLGYLQRGNRQRARTNLLKALEKNKDSGAAHNGLALLFQMEDESELAEEYFLKAISYEPELTRVRNNYGVFLFRQDRYEDAYQQFLVASEDINYRRRANVFFSMGQAAKKLGQSDRAQEAWEKAATLNADLPEPFLELATAYFSAKDFPRAKRYLERYDQLSKPSPRALWLALRLEDTFGNKDAVASKALALTKLFPYSKEALEYKAWLKAY